MYDEIYPIETTRHDSYGEYEVEPTKQELMKKINELVEKVNMLTEAE